MRALKFSHLKPHIIFWSVFILYELILGYYLVNKFSSFWDYAGHYALYIGLFYFNAHVVFSYALNDTRKNYFLLILFILGEFVLYILVKEGLYYLYHIFNVYVYPADIQQKRFLLNSIWRGVYFIFLSTGYWFALTTIKNREKIADLENIKLKNELHNQILEKSLLTAENAYLKSQINPHFLLNTLNFLYNSVAKLSDKAADSILLLSDIMRYALTTTDADGKVRLEQEVDNIESFVKLNQARFNERLSIQYELIGETNGLRIIPLVLITFVENVFKYGDLLSTSNPAKIVVHVEGDTLNFSTYNLKRRSVQYDSHGIGINNVKNRLDLHYKYNLMIDDNDLEYKLMLKVKL